MADSPPQRRPDTCPRPACPAGWEGVEATHSPAASSEDGNTWPGGSSPSRPSTRRAATCLIRVDPSALQIQSALEQRVVVSSRFAGVDQRMERVLELAEQYRPFLGMSLVVVVLGSAKDGVPVVRAPVESSGDDLPTGVTFDADAEGQMSTIDSGQSGYPSRSRRRRRVPWPACRSARSRSVCASASCSGLINSGRIWIARTLISSEPRVSRSVCVGDRKVARSSAIHLIKGSAS